jgi:hypothetical protein
MRNALEKRKGIELIRQADGRSLIKLRRSEAALTNAIREYVAAHPHAMDTLEGIADWWVASNGARPDELTLNRVLGRLVREGLLEIIRTGRRKLYRLRQQK